MDRSLHQPTRSAKRRLGFAACLCAFFLPVLLPGAGANAQSAAQFRAFVEGVWPQANARNVSRQTFDAAFRDVTPDPEVLELSRKQPEFKATIGEYVTKRVSETRVANGRAKLQEWAPILEAIEKFYGVDRYTVLAVWGMETNYGGFMGGHSVIRALATLACCSHRTAYFRAELLNALDVLQQGHVRPDQMTGSWAGAMGHTQFMPSSFKRYAADGSADGRRDIWNTIPDALASTANYLKEHRWRAGETWGYEVVLGEGFDLRKNGRGTKRALGDWAKLGVERANGQPFPRATDVGTLLLPAGLEGPAFLVLANFSVIKRYNNADSYALAVGHLADRIRGGGPFVRAFPLPPGALTQDERTELQKLLAGRGYDVGEPDGEIGTKTREAIRAFRTAQGLATDGDADQTLLKRLRAGR
jgi:membrane-bound lytic murein transglycosylase B